MLLVSPSAGTIVPREPVRTTLRFPLSAPLRFAPSVCVRAPTRGPMSLRGEPVFQTKDSQPKKSRRGLDFTSAEPNTIGLIAANPGREERRSKMKESINVGNVALGPSLSRSSLQLVHFKHNMQTY